MKYTNKHIKEEYKLNQIGRTIGMILLVIGILLVGFGWKSVVKYVMMPIQSF